MAMGADNKVVSMEFDNSKFEKNVAVSMATLDKLEKKLEFKDATDSFDKIEKASNNVKLDGISKSLDELNKKFGVVGTIGRKSIEEFTSYAIDKLKGLYNNTLGKITQGGWNRAMNIENAKFQLKGLGIAWDDVYDSIKYAVDGTAYGLDSAAKTAGQLAASGVELGDDMSTALRAISGSAAMANRSYDDMATVFITAASKGRVMGDELNRMSDRGINAQQVLAKAMGKTEAEIREMASKSQISFEQFAKAMDDAYGEHAKAANETFQGSMDNIGSALARIGEMFQTPIIQNAPQVFNAIRESVDDLKALLKPVADDFAEFVSALATGTTEMIKSQEMTELLTNLLNILGNIAGNLMTIFLPIGQAISDAFPQGILATIADFTGKIADFTEGVWFSNNALDAIYQVTTVFFDLLGTAVDVIGAIMTAAEPIVNRVLAPALNFIMDLITQLGILMDWLRQTVFTTENIQAAGELAATGINYVIDKVSEFAGTLSGVYSNVRAKIAGIFDWLAQKISGLNNGKEFQFAFIDKLKDKVGELGTWLKKALDIISDFVSKFKFPTFEQVCNAIKDGFDKVISGAQNFGNFLGDIVNKIAGHSQDIATFLNGIKTKVTEFITFITNIIDVKTIAQIAFFILLGKLVSTTTDTMEQLGGMLGSFKGVFKSISGSFDGLTSLFKKMEDSIKYDNAVKIASAVAVITAAIIGLANIPVDDLGKAIAALTIVFLELFIALAILERFLDAANKKIQGQEMKKVGDSLTNQINNVGDAVSNGAKTVSEGISGAFKQFGDAISGGINNFLGSLGKAAEHLTTTIEIVGVLLALAASVKIMASAVNDLNVAIGEGNWNGLIAAIALIVTLTAATAVLGHHTEKLNVGATYFLSFAGSVWILAQAIEQLGTMDIFELIFGFTAISLLIAELVVATEEMSQFADKLDAAIIPTMLSFALSVTILAGVVQQLGEMIQNPEQYVAGLAGLGAVLMEMWLFFVVMQDVDTDGVVQAMIGFAAAMALLIVPILALGAAMQSHADVIGAGLLTIGLALIVIGGIIMVLSPFADGMVQVSEAILIANAAFLVGAIGLGAFSIALGLLVATIAGSATAIVAAGGVITLAITTLINAILIAIQNSAVNFAGAVAAVVSAILTTIKQMTKLFSSVVITIIDEMLAALAAHSKSIAESVVTIIDNVLTVIGEHTESIVDAVLNILGGVIMAIVHKIPEIVAAVVDIFKTLVSTWDEWGPKFIKAASDAGMWLGDVLKSIGSAIWEGFKELLASIFEHLKDFFDKAIQSGIDFVKGFASGIFGNKDTAIKEAEAMGLDAVEALNDSIGAHSDADATIESATNFVGGFAHTVTNMASDAGDAATNMGNVAVDALQQVIPDGATGAGDMFASNLSSSIGNGIPTVTNGIQVLGNGLGANMQEIMDEQGGLAGMKFDTAMLDGIDSNLSAVANGAFNLGDVAGRNAYNGSINWLDKAANAFNSVFSMGNAKSTVSTPVDVAQKKSSEKKANMSQKELEDWVNSVIEKDKAKKAAATATTLPSATGGGGGGGKSSGGGGGSGGGSSTAKTTQEVKELFNVLKDGAGTITAFQNRFVKLNETLDETSDETAQNAQAFEIAKGAVSALAEQLFEASDSYDETMAAMNKSSAEYLAGMKEAWDEYKESLESTLVGSVDAFSAFTQASHMSAEDILDNIYSEITGLEMFDETIRGLANSNINPTLLKDLVDGGIQNMDKLMGLLYATDQQRESISKAYETLTNVESNLTDKVMASLALSVDSYDKSIQETLENSEVFQEGMSKLSDNTQFTTSQIVVMFNETQQGLKEIIKSGMNYFDEYEKKQKVSKKTLQKNLDDQKKAWEDWGDALNEVIAKGLDKSVIQNLMEMGVESMDKLQGFKDMTEEEIGHYNETIAEYIKIPDKLSAEIAANYTATALDVSNAFRDGIDSTKAEEAIAEMGNNLEQALKDAVGDKGEVQGSALSKAFDDGFKENAIYVYDTIKEFGQNVLDELEIDEGGIADIGENLMKSLAASIKDNSYLVVDALQEVAEDGIDITEETVKIGSPSKVFMDIGKYIDQGLAIGIRDNANDVTKQTKRLGNETYKAMDAIVEHILDILEGNEEFNPVITPVLNLDEVNYGLKYINGNLMDMQMGLQDSLMNARMVAEQARVMSQESYYNTPVTINVYGNSDPNAVAEAVQNRLNHQIRRIGAIS